MVLEKCQSTGLEVHREMFGKLTEEAENSREVPISFPELFPRCISCFSVWECFLPCLQGPLFCLIRKAPFQHLPFLLIPRADDQWANLTVIGISCPICKAPRQRKASGECLGLNTATFITLSAQTLPLKHPQQTDLKPRQSRRDFTLFPCVRFMNFLVTRELF